MRQLTADEVGALARNLRRHRRALGWRSAELAEYLEVSAVYLAALELGAIFRPFPEPLARLARLMDLEDWTDLLLAPSAGGGGKSPTMGAARGCCPPEMPTADAAERFLKRRGGASDFGSAFTGR